MSSPTSSSQQIPSSTSDVTAKPLFGNCWSCRLLSGTGLILSAGYVYLAANKRMRRGAPTSVGTVAQIVFAAGLAAWGIVIIADPVGKAVKKT